MRSANGILGLMLGAACLPMETTGLPPRPADVQTVALAIFEGSDLMSVHLVEDRFAAGYTSNQSQVLLHFAQSRSDLELTNPIRSQLRPAGPNSECPLPLPTPAGVFERTNGEWRDAELPASLARYVYEGDCTCPRLETVATSTVVAVRPPVLFLDRGEVYVAAEHIYRMEGTELTRVVTLPDPTIAMTRDGETLWLSAGDRMLTGDLRAGLEEVQLTGGATIAGSQFFAPALGSNAVWAIAVRHLEMGFNRQSIIRIDQSSYAIDVIDSRRFTHESAGQPVGFSLGAEVLLARADENLARFRDGAPSQEERLTDGQPLLGVTVIDQVPGYGLLASIHEKIQLGSDDQIARRTDDGWEVLEGRFPAIDVRSFAAYDGGFFYGGDDGRYGFYHRSLGFCIDDGKLPSGAPLGHLLIMGDQMIATTQENDMDENGEPIGVGTLFWLQIVP